MLVQFEFIACVTHYVKFVNRHFATSKRSAHFSLPDNVPLLGPRFIPPTPHLVSKYCRNRNLLVPEAYYLCPVTIVHPLFYPICCPNCQKASGTPETLWDDMNSHDLSLE